MPWRRRWLLAREPELLTGVVERALDELLGWYGPRGGAITVIQRFGSALNLNVHFHILALDGHYERSADGRPEFRRARPPTTDEVGELVADIAERVERWLRREGHVEDDEPVDDDAQSLIQAASVAGRHALSRSSRVRRVQTLGGREFALPDRCASYEGYNLHAGVVVGAKDRSGLERLCRYVNRPALAKARLSETEDGGVLLELRHPWSDGTTALRFTPAELVEKLIALIPPPWSHQVRYHGVLAARSAWRSRVVPKRPPRRPGRKLTKRPSARSSWVPWSDLLHRVFGIDGWKCPRCGGRLRLRAVVEDPGTAERILGGLASSCRGPPSSVDAA